MENEILNIPQVIHLRPAAMFAFFKVMPLIVCALIFLFLAWWIYPVFVWLSLLTLMMGIYRFAYIRNISYVITPELLRISRGLFFKRTDQVELWRIKDYIITRSFLLQMLSLMDLELKGTDSENPVVWLRGIPHSTLVDTLRIRVNEARQHNRLFEIN